MNVLKDGRGILVANVQKDGQEIHVVNVLKVGQEILVVNVLEDGQGNLAMNVLKTTIRLDNVQSSVNLKLTNTHALKRERCDVQKTSTGTIVHNSAEMQIVMSAVKRVAKSAKIIITQQMTAQCFAKKLQALHAMNKDKESANMVITQRANVQCSVPKL